MSCPPVSVGRGVLLLALCLSSAGLAQDAVRREIDALLRDPYFQRVEVGIMVARLDDPPAGMQILYQRLADKPLIPASNNKLLTSAAAIHHLGADFRFRTALLTRQTAEGMELALVGDGDPTLGDAVLMQQLGWKQNEVFDRWARLVAGLGQPVAKLRVDDSVFDTEFLHPNWPGDQVLLHYVAQVGGLNYGTNVVSLNVRAAGENQPARYSLTPMTDYVTIRNSAVGGSRSAVWFERESGSNQISVRGEASGPTGELRVTIHDPSMFAGTILVETLRNAGTRVGGVERDRSVREALKNDADGWRVLAVHETPLAAALGRTNKNSVNMYAEALIKRAAHASTRRPGSWSDGQAAVGAYLRGIGVVEGDFSIDDGSGLSRRNSITPRGMLRVLESNWHAPHRRLFVDSLAVASQDGTLANRLRDGPGARVRAKSGFINSVSCLSGYLESRSGRNYAFVILMNGSIQSNSVAREWQDRIVTAIDRAVD